MMNNPKVITTYNTMMLASTEKTADGRKRRTTRNAATEKTDLA